MPETRTSEVVYGLGGYDPTKPNSNVIETKTRVVSDEELVEEAETKALAKVDTLIDGITSLAEAKVFLKRLCKRLVTKGYLP